MKRIFVFVMLLAPFLAYGEGQKLAVIKAEAPESLWKFLSAAPGSLELQIFYVIVIGGFAGVFVNYAVKWMKKEIAGSLGAYLFVDNVRGTLLSWTTTIGAGVAGITSGMFETPDGTFIGWFRVLVLCFGNGFFWDAVINKGQKPA